jgi:hypothetical protein
MCAVKQTYIYEAKHWLELGLPVNAVLRTWRDADAPEAPVTKTEEITRCQSILEAEETADTLNAAMKNDREFADELPEKANCDSRRRQRFFR